MLQFLHEVGEKQSPPLTSVGAVYSTASQNPPRLQPPEPITAVLVTVEGAPLAHRTVDDLRREVIDIAVTDSQIFGAIPDPARSIYLIWAPPGLPETWFKRVVSWGQDTDPRIGLLGYAPEGSVADCESALAAGFDDYVVGELSNRELAARIRAIYRRMHWRLEPSSSRLAFGPVLLDTHTHEVWVHGNSRILTGIETAVLHALISAGGRTLERAELLDAAWGEMALEISERAVDNVILRLRRKLETPGLIRTVRGVGFRLDEG